MRIGKCYHTIREIAAIISPVEFRKLRAMWQAAQRVTKSGGRNGGRPPVPTACPKCGERCASARGARGHCRG